MKKNAGLEKQLLHTRLPFLMSLYTRMTTLCPSTMLAREYNFLSSCASGILKQSTLHPVYTIMGYPLPPRSTQHPCIYTNIHQCVFTNNLHSFSFCPSVLMRRRVRVELHMNHVFFRASKADELDDPQMIFVMLILSFPVLLSCPLPTAPTVPLPPAPPPNPLEPCWVWP
jgi:hypothetical protein